MIAGLAYRETAPQHRLDGDTVAVLVHGFPESSYMWRALLADLEAAGVRAVAPDLPGYGDSPPDPPGTWERHVDALERFRLELGLRRVAVVTHDWGVLIGLRWACDHPEAVVGLVISDGGFFADRRWHAFAATLRTPGEGESAIESFTEEGFAAMLHQLSPGMTDAAIAEYWKGMSTPVGRRGALELYRSGDFEKLAPYEPRLAALEVPSLVIWGAGDPFSSPKMAERYQEALTDAQTLVVPDAGHFVWEDAPEVVNPATVEFLGRICAAR